MAGTTVNPYRFGGQVGYRRDGTNRNYVRERTLDTRQGRWLSKDPNSTLFLGLAPDLLQLVPKIVANESFNIYWYSKNNPVNRVDPSGRASRPCDGAARKSCIDYCAKQYNSMYSCTHYTFRLVNVTAEWDGCSCFGDEPGEVCNCTKARLIALESTKTAACLPTNNNTRKCYNGMGCTKAKLLLAAYVSCAALRFQINTECYGGGDPSHKRRAIDTLNEAVPCALIAASECKSKL